jgi:hypothetical protein
MHPQSFAVRYRFKPAEKTEADGFRFFFCGFPITVVIKNGTEAQFIKTPAERVPIMTFDQRPCQRYKAIPESDYADDD